MLNVLMDFSSSKINLVAGEGEEYKKVRCKSTLVEENMLASLIQDFSLLIILKRFNLKSIVH
jgi:hypothetical protein